jgi:hypothetical protein
MADLNARIKPKKSSTTGEVPQAADLEVAEIAVNTADGKLFVKHTDNSIKEISGGTDITTESIDALSDVDTTTIAPADGQVLAWVGANSQWEPADAAPGGATAIDDLTDVDTSTAAPTDGQVLTWVGANNQWEAVDTYLGGTTRDLDDISPSAPTSGQILAFDVPVPITSDTKLYIDFNNQLVDGSGSTHTVTESSAHSFVADVPPGSSATHSILFPASSSSRVLVADSPDFNWDSGDFTFEAWVKGTVVESGEGVYLASQRNTYSNQN